MANLSQMSDPFAVRRDATNSVGNGTDDVRLGLGGLGHPLPGGGTFGFGSGIFPTVTASGAITDCQVQANTPTPNMGAVVNFGNYQIARSYHGIYLGSITAPVPITFAAANASNPRIDLVVIRIRDGDVDTPLPERTADIVVFTGTPSATPVAPTDQLTEGDFLLASVTIWGMQVLSSDIVGHRVYAVARGGIYPASSADTRAGGFPGQMRYNMVSSTYEGWEAVSGAWVPVTSLTSWSSFAPELYYQPSGQPVDFTRVCNLGSGKAVSCRYRTIGKELRLNYYFDWGTSPWNMGYGPIFTLLPAGTYAKQETHLHTELFVSSNSSRWHGNTVIFAGSNIMYMQFPTSSGDCRLGYYQGASSSSQLSGTGIPFISGNFPQGGTLSIVGIMEIQ